MRKFWGVTYGKSSLQIVRPKADMGRAAEAVRKVNQEWDGHDGSEGTNATVPEVCDEDTSCEKMRPIGGVWAAGRADQPNRRAGCGHHGRDCGVRPSQPPIGSGSLATVASTPIPQTVIWQQVMAATPQKYRFVTGLIAVA